VESEFDQCIAWCLPRQMVMTACMVFSAVF